MNALITGSSRGIGLGIAKELAKIGYNLGINGVRPYDEVISVIKELKSFGVEVIYLQGDISKSSDRERVADEFLKEFGVPNLLVNNAGVAPKVRSDMLELDEDSLDYLFSVNLKGSYFFTQFISKKMIEEKNRNKKFSANIVNIGSISAEIVSVNRADYCITKAGIAMMSRLYATRLGEYGINVFEIRPGIIKTDMTNCVTEKYDKLIGDGLCLTKRWGTPEDVGRVVSVIAQGNFSYSTGQIFYVDGNISSKIL